MISLRYKRFNWDIHLVYMVVVWDVSFTRKHEDEVF